MSAQDEKLRPGADHTRGDGVGTDEKGQRGVEGAERKLTLSVWGEGNPSSAGWVLGVRSPQTTRPAKSRDQTPTRRRRGQAADNVEDIG